MRSFQSLNEQEILALAISLEEEDARIYDDFADALKDSHPAQAEEFRQIRAEEDGHRHRLLTMYRERFGEHIPLIRRQDVKGFVRRRPVWLVRPLGLHAVRKTAALMEAETQHPGVTVQRTAVSYANLITKVLQDASAGDMPNLVLLDNPNVPQVAATGQLRAFNDLPGFTTSGYYPGAIKEWTYQGKQYCYPIGTNSVGLFYNKAMLKAAGLQPPTTWDELAADAKKLTKPPVYGMAFDATADEQSTWQLEPFFWSNGASLTNVNTPAFASALQLWVNMVKDGSASKSVLNWGQDPDLTQQFTQGHAAMMVNGPWIFPELNQKGWKYNDQYGIVPIPTNHAGQTVIAPLGGETIDLGTGGSTEQ